MNILDILVLILSLIGILLEMYQKPLFWLIYITASIILAFQFYIAHLYGSTLLQFIYIILSIYGWLKWNCVNQIQINHTTYRQIIIYLIVSTIMIIGFYYILKNTQDDNPLTDAVLTSICIIATYMAIYKQIENWFVFSLSVLISIPLYYHYEMYFTCITYLIFGILDFSGGIKWLKQYNSNISKKSYR